MKQWLILILISLFFSGCFTNRHHLNRGKILAPGRSENTWALSTHKFYNCPETYAKGDKTFCKDSEDNSGYFLEPEEGFYLALSRGFRLGIIDTFWVFKGIDFGYQVEIPHTTEFDVRLGLPWASESWHHALSLGWAWGLMLDNSYFGEYAIGWQKNSLELFSNMRVTRRATLARDLENSGDDEQSSFDFSQNDWFVEFGGGVSIAAPEIFILPDRYSFSFHGSVPKINFGQGALEEGQGDFSGVYWVVGWGWDY